MHQLGLNPLPLQTGASFVYPGPRTHDGLLIEPQDQQESQKTLKLVNQMIGDLTDLNKNENDCPHPDLLKKTWHDDMIWYGPAGIGASYTNTYGEENIRNLINMYHSLDDSGMQQMIKMVLNFSQSTDLATSYVSVGVLHALGQKEGVAEAYRWANTQEDAQRIISHFEIGKSVADYFSTD